MPKTVDELGVAIQKKLASTEDEINAQISYLKGQSTASQVKENRDAAQMGQFKRNCLILFLAITVLERMQSVVKQIKKMDAAMLSSIIKGEQVDVRSLILMENSMRQSQKIKWVYFQFSFSH